MIRNKKPYSLDKLNLTNPQKAAVAKLLTAQKNKYKKLLHEAHERMHIIADMTTSLEFWYNVNGHYEFISPSCERVLGYKPEEFMNSEVSLEQICHPDFLEQFRRDRALAFEGQSGDEVEYLFVRKDGSHHWVKLTWNPVFTRRERHIGIRISLRDITEFKTSQMLGKAYEQLTDLIADELADVGIFSFDADRKLISWNSGAQRMFGYEADETIRQDFATLLDPLSVPGFERLDFTSGQVITDLIFRKKDGEAFGGVLKCFTLTDDKGHLYQVTCLLRPGAARA